MKKLILGLSLATICAACCPSEMYYATWTIRNLTDRTILFVPPPLAGYVYSTTLKSGEECDLYFRVDYDERTSFYELLANWEGWADENIAFEILTPDGALLKRWKYLDKDSWGKQFFNESSWRLAISSKDREEQKLIWTFRILPEDLD